MAKERRWKRRAGNTAAGSTPALSSTEAWLSGWKAPVLKIGGRKARGFESHRLLWKRARVVEGARLLPAQVMSLGSSNLPASAELDSRVWVYGELK
jgi:hypothetical protein